MKMTKFMLMAAGVMSMTFSVLAADVAVTITGNDTMQFDKKVLNGVIRLIVPDAIGAVSIVGDIDHQAVVEAWHYVGAELA